MHGSDKLPTEFNASHSTAALVGAAIFVCVVAPIAEEFFFRGFFFGALRKWRIMIGEGRNIGVWVAAVVTGLLFGLAHTGSASSQYLIPLGFLGFILCMVRWRTRSLYPCIALHSANNALALGGQPVDLERPGDPRSGVASPVMGRGGGADLAPDEPLPAPGLELGRRPFLRSSRPAGGRASLTIGDG